MLSFIVLSENYNGRVHQHKSMTENQWSFYDFSAERH